MHILFICFVSILVTLYTLHSFAVGLRGSHEDLNKILDGRCEVGRFTSFVFYFPAFLIRIFKFAITSLFQL